jgi:hypothetical protein
MNLRGPMVTLLGMAPLRAVFDPSGMDGWRKQRRGVPTFNAGMDGGATPAQQGTTTDLGTLGGDDVPFVEDIF